jgi:multiple sugar transport system permease protein
VGRYRAKTKRGGALIREMWDKRQCYLYISPLLVFFLLLNFVSVAFSVYISLHRWRPGGSPRFIGADNYIRLLQDDMFWMSLRNSVSYAVMVIAIGIPLALLLALALDSGLRARAVLTVAYYLPVVTAAVVVVVIWRWLLNPNYGIVNYYLERVGLPRYHFLGDKRLALPAVAAMGVWQMLGYNAVLFLAGLQGIPRELHDAARVDGASGWRRFWSITLPLLKPTLLFVMVLSTIRALQVFEQVQLLPSPGGPLGATTTGTFFIYKQAFDFFKMGYASAAAVVLGLVILVLSVVQARVMRTEEMN